MDGHSNVAEQLKILKKEYPTAKYYLDFSNPLQLLVAAILSAQCRDEVVNSCTKELFKKYKTAGDFSKLDESDIKSITFFKNKAKNIREACKILDAAYGVPQTMEGLTELPGIGRKTANVILANAFNIILGIPVDTHYIRVSYRLGWTKSKNPDIIERDSMNLIPKSEWKIVPHLLKAHGRAVCKPIPECSRCCVNNLCPKNGVTKST
ncbi:MAG: endonuclease III [Candidatus Aenigmarchaeota archaeon]|nr:endonuclease III [Candidatus Aenigmarchaeota archaeon]